MTTHAIRAAQTSRFGARELVYIVLGLVALALVVAALASRDGSASVPGSAVTSGKAVAISYTDNPN